MKSFINFLYVKCFREFCIVDKISKNFSEGKQNNNRKTFLGASHCIYLKFLKMYITFRIHKMPVCCNSLLLHLSTKKMKGGGRKNTFKKPGCFVYAQAVALESYSLHCICSEVLPNISQLAMKSCT